MESFSKTLLVLPVLAAGWTACKSDDAEHALTATGAVVAGAQDSHCGTKVVEISTAACQGSTADAGADGGAESTPDYGPTMFGGEGDDDDCKYHVKWSVASSGGSASHGLVTFTVTITDKKSNAPVTDAPVDVEAFLDETHPAPNTDQTSKETGTAGTYTVGPVAFDKSGQWTVRFHIHDDCDDSEESPHGHAAFFMLVEVK